VGGVDGHYWAPEAPWQPVNQGPGVFEPPCESTPAAVGKGHRVVVHGSPLSLWSRSKLATKADVPEQEQGALDRLLPNCGHQRCQRARGWHLFSKLEGPCFLRSTESIVYCLLARSCLGAKGLSSAGFDDSRRTSTRAKGIARREVTGPHTHAWKWQDHACVASRLPRAEQA
jgi:hypothetical protein